MPDLIAKRRPRGKSPEVTTSLGEWIWVTLFLLTLSLVIGSESGLNHIELTLYDGLLDLKQGAPNSDIVLIGIDDATLTEFGPWPFSNDTEIRLLTALNASRPRAVGFLMPLGTGPDHAPSANTPTPGGDREALVAAMTANGHVALDTGPFGADQSVGARVQPLLAGAAALGWDTHVGDDDGVVRRAPLSSASGAVSAGGQHFVTAMLEAADMHMPLPGLRAAEIDGGPTGVGDHWVLIPYSGPPGHYPVVSYRDVLNGRVAPSTLADKMILVGPTAKSLVHYEKVPGGITHGFGPRLMTPLEINANLLAGVLDNRTITALSPLRNALGCAIPVTLAMLVLIGVPRRALGLIIAIAIATFLASVVALTLRGIWFAPGGALVCLALALPLWRWRLLEGDAIRGELILKRLEDAPSHYAEVGLPPVNPQSGRVERRLQILNRTIARVATLRSFVDHVIDAMPHVTLVTDVEGHVMAENRLARTYFGSLGYTQIEGAQLPYLLGSLDLEGAAEGRSWWDVLDKSLPSTRARARDARGRDLVIRAVPWNNANGDLSGWVATLDDVSAIRTAERRRDEALDFMSSSLSVTQESILEALSTLDVSQLGPAGSALTQSIEASSTEALALTEKFIELSNAESRDYDFVVCDVSDAIELAIDAVYAIAQKHHARFSFRRPDAAVVANIDTLMLSRAVSILLANAVRFAATGERVEVAIDADDDQVALRVVDRGRGIAPGEQVRMVRALQDIQLPGGARGPAGYHIGLGLSLVRTVAERHFGKLEFTSNPGNGSEFRIILPPWAPAAHPQAETASDGEAAL